MAEHSISGWNESVATSSICPRVVRETSFCQAVSVFDSRPACVPIISHLGGICAKHVFESGDEGQSLGTISGFCCAAAFKRRAGSPLASKSSGCYLATGLIVQLYGALSNFLSCGSFPSYET